MSLHLPKTSTKAAVIEAAKTIAEDPTDAHVGKLLHLAFALPLGELPRDFIDPFLAEEQRRFLDQHHGPISDQPRP